MRVNGVMGVIAVACVVAVVNGASLGPMGRLHHKNHWRVANIRRFTGMDLVDVQLPPPPPIPLLQISRRQTHSGRFVFLPEPAQNNSPPDPIDTPQLLLSAFTESKSPPGKTPTQDGPPQILLQPPPAPALPAIGAQSLAATGVPEPTTWAMMILGLAGIGAGLRRHRRRASGAGRIAHAP